MYEEKNHQIKIEMLACTVCDVFRTYRNDETRVLQEQTPRRVRSIVADRLRLIRGI